MQIVDGTRLFSAKDLLGFLGCTHSTALDIQVGGGSIALPEGEAEDKYLKLLADKGNAHEASYLEQLKKEGRDVREIAGKEQPLSVRAEQTRQAMHDGVSVIYQGALVSLPWHGYSDFLLRVDTPSKLGGWSYEVADTKLARTAKPKHVLQLCLYSQMIALVQEQMPVSAHVLLGDGNQFRFRLNDYIHYCDSARERFLRFAVGTNIETVAEPCAHCATCRWSDRCDAEWVAADHLSLVARMSGVQSRKLRKAGITTRRQLAELPADRTVPKMQREALDRIRDQARLQVAKDDTGKDSAELLPAAPRHGFDRLPRPDAGDLFFDMEGDPVYSAEGSLEYLFGFHHVDDGVETFTPFWAYDRAGEKKAFEGALDFITDRLRRFPDAFVYHYAAYEETALRRLAQQYGSSKRQQDDAIKRLAQTYGTRENEVDDLLRNRKLVDLYKVVREGVRVSEPRYSLKNLETFYAPARTENIQSGGDSVVAFENWLTLRDDQILRDIEEYNAFDCRSTMLCRDWLLSLRPESAIWFDAQQEKSDAEAERETKRREQDTHILAMRERLIANVSDAERPWRELLGFLLEFHRREDRREWWQFFARLEGTEEKLIDDVDCIAGLIRDASVAPVPEKRSMVHTFTYPEQEIKRTDGSAYRTDTKKSVDIMSVDPALRHVALKIGPKAPVPDGPFALIPTGPIDSSGQRDAIERYAQSVIEGRTDAYRAITSILRKEIPRAPLSEMHDPVAGAIEAVSRMDETHLVIQGPPGTGKTYTSAHAIVALLKQGKRVGVTAMTHEAINNLLRCVEDVADEQGVTFTGAKKSSDDQQLNGRIIVDVDDNAAITEGTHGLVAGTAWLFSRKEMDQKLDYLFVDEAGQESLAKVVASGTSARNIILVGDQMQLSQPVKGAHPGGSGTSALDYLMGDWATVPPDRGIFLAETRRMHPDLCRFVSEAFYDGRLKSHASTAQQRLIVNDDEALSSTGLKFVAVEHEENSQRSPEEAERVLRIYEALIGQDWVNEKGETRPIEAKDILVVSPYNMQVNLLAETLPDGARVGTVDRFQGQEGAVVLISMAASDASQAPRGISFLFSRNRMNVALSRGRCLAAVVASPELTSVSVGSIEQLKLVNSLCWAECCVKLGGVART